MGNNLVNGDSWLDTASGLLLILVGTLVIIYVVSIIIKNAKGKDHHWEHKTLIFVSHDKWAVDKIVGNVIYTTENNPRHHIGPFRMCKDCDDIQQYNGEYWCEVQDRYKNGLIKAFKEVKGS